MSNAIPTRVIDPSSEGKALKPQREMPKLIQAQLQPDLQRRDDLKRNQDDLRGWVPAPDTRGTIDIIWSSASTIFVCVWVMLHLNVPAKRDSNLVQFLRKLKWFVLALLAPELLMLFAGGQWASAQRSTKAMATLGANGWSLVHAFYADSGGFMLQAPGSVEFPVTAQQIHYLVEKKYIPIPDITRDEIWDKSKADLFAKFIAILQSGWFVIQIVARAIQSVPISLLELSTITLMCCTAATMFFWFHKPLNVDTPTTLHIPVSIRDVLAAAGLSDRDWRETPLDFADRLEYSSSKMPFNHLWGEEQRPLPRIPNDKDSWLHNWRMIILIAIPTAAFGTLQLIPWNFVFPSRTEQLLWRYTCLSNGILLGLGCAMEAGAIVASNFKVAGLHTFHDYKLHWPTNIFFFLPGCLYFAARIIIIVEVLISLRALDPGCFDSVQWTAILPHI